MGSGREYYSERERDADNLTNPLVCFGNLCPLDNSFTCLDTLKCTFVCLWDSWLDTLRCTGKYCNAVFFSMSLGFFGGEVGANSRFASETTLKSVVPLERIGQILQNLLICDGKSPLPHCPPLPLLLFFPFFLSRMEQEMGMHVFFCVCSCVCIFPSHLNGL